VEGRPEWRTQLNNAILRHGQAFLGKILLDSGKVEGIAPDLADEIYGNEEIDYLILEGDGSAGHPVKAPGVHEPVVPASATMVIAVLGLDGMWRTADPEVIFRLDAFEEITGTKPGQTLTPEILSRIFLDPRGMFKGAPMTARRIVFLNKVDLMEEDQGARDLASTLLHEGSGKIDRVVIGSLIEKRYHVREADNERDL
jgi:probable selenium-dependent hydroxylase accessory protein YqeC